MSESQTQALEARARELLAAEYEAAEARRIVVEVLTEIGFHDAAKNVSTGGGSMDLSVGLEAVKRALRSKPSAATSEDVVRLIIAARVVAFDGYFDHVADEQARAAIKELDEASEAFASAVPWDEEPENG